MTARWNRNDICEAWLVYGMRGGGWTKVSMYALTRLGGMRFKESATLSSAEDLTANGRMIFDGIVALHG